MSDFLIISCHLPQQYLEKACKIIGFMARKAFTALLLHHLYLGQSLDVTGRYKIEMQTDYVPEQSDTIVQSAIEFQRTNLHFELPFG